MTNTNTCRLYPAQIQGTIMAPLSTAASAWSSGTNLYWLMFNRVDGLRVTGNGVLDGSGQSWWVRRCHSDAHAVSIITCYMLLLCCFSFQAPNLLSLPQACVESAPTVRNIVRADYFHAFLSR